MVMLPTVSLTVSIRMISVAVVVLAILGVHRVNAACGYQKKSVVYETECRHAAVQRARCPQSCLSGVCDDVTGNCVVDWGSGVDSHLQVTRIGCPRGFHGNDCTQVCPANCINSTCSQATGQCTQGCKAGFTGSDCTSVCPEGFHGENCALPCPERCLNSTCTPQSGVCSSGCVEGFWGSDCSLGVGLDRSSSADRRSFYSHLSAQGKSVLLYLLTSRYEHALARVQFEIERAVQDRNEIQDILQG